MVHAIGLLKVRLGSLKGLDCEHGGYSPTFPLEKVVGVNRPK